MGLLHFLSLEELEEIEDGLQQGENIGKEIIKSTLEIEQAKGGCSTKRQVFERFVRVNWNPCKTLLNLVWSGQAEVL